eukprot:2118672-Alexandrium_andersonii.AAC.1
MRHGVVGRAGCSDRIRPSRSKRVQVTRWPPTRRCKSRRPRQSSAAARVSACAEGGKLTHAAAAPSTAANT